MDDQNPETKPTKVARSFDAYAVREGADGKGHFHKIGAAFAHKEGQGHDIDLVAAPTNGRITLRTPQDRVKDMRGQEEEKSNEPVSRRSKRRRRDKEREWRGR